MHLRDLAELRDPVQLDEAPRRAIDRGAGALGEIGPATVGERTQRQQEVLDALTLLGTASLRDLAESTGQEKGNCFRRLQALVKDGAVVRQDGRGQVLYAITE